MIRIVTLPLYWLLDYKFSCENFTLGFERNSHGNFLRVVFLHLPCVHCGTTLVLVLLALLGNELHDYPAIVAMQMGSREDV